MRISSESVSYRRVAEMTLCHQGGIENPSHTDHDQPMKCAARLPLTFALGLIPLLGYGDSRNMAAQVNSSLPGVEFQFTRLVYQENPNYARGWGGWGMGRRWMTDAPEAETHLLQGIKRLTRVNAASEGTAIRLDDDSLFDHPFL